MSPSWMPPHPRRRASLLRRIVLPTTACCAAVIMLVLVEGRVVAADPQGPRVTVETVTGESPGVLKGLDTSTPPTLILEDRRIPLADVLRIGISPPIPHRRELEVTLADGSRLYGGIGKGSDASHLAFNGRLFPDGIKIPLEWIRVLTYHGITTDENPGSNTPPIQPSEQGDILLTRKGATLTGVLGGISASTVTFQDNSLGKLELPWEEVRAVAIAPLGAPPALPKGKPEIALDATGGSYVEGVLLALDANSVHLQNPVLGEFAVELRQVDAIEIRLGRVVYLSERDPKKVIEKAPGGLGFHWPWQRDRNVHDLGPLRIGDRTFRRGLGVHAISRLTFPVLKGDRQFQAWVGIDATGRPADDNPDYGAVVFRVLVDGEKRYESGVVNWQTPPQRVQVDVKGAHEIELDVDAGPGSIVLDRADWGDARILRE